MASNHNNNEFQASRLEVAAERRLAELGKFEPDQFPFVATQSGTVTYQIKAGRKAGAAAGETGARVGEPSGARYGALKHAFPWLIPKKPYCADYLSDGLIIRARKAALTKRHIQLNGPSAVQWIAHDLDYSGAARLAYRDAYLPPPNAIVSNRQNGHAHALTLLETPVAKHFAARLKPLEYLAAIERGMARRLNADRSYTGLMAKNPLHNFWDVEWRRDEPYSLQELDDWLFDRDKRQDSSVTTTYGFSRNCICFDRVRTFAYSEVLSAKRAGKSVEDFQARLEKAASEVNLHFREPLPLSEIRAIAKSVAKWTWRNFSPEHLHARQSARGKRGMAKRWAGHVAANQTKPWEAEGISRRTWYRHKKITV